MYALKARRRPILLLCCMLGAIFMIVSKHNSNTHSHISMPFYTLAMWRHFECTKNPRVQPVFIDKYETYKFCLPTSTPPSSASSSKVLLLLLLCSAHTTNSEMCNVSSVISIRHHNLIHAFKFTMRLRFTPKRVWVCLRLCVLRIYWMPCSKALYIQSNLNAIST